MKTIAFSIFEEATEVDVEQAALKDLDVPFLTRKELDYYLALS